MNVGYQERITICVEENTVNINIYAYPITMMATRAMMRMTQKDSTAIIAVKFLSNFAAISLSVIPSSISGTVEYITIHNAKCFNIYYIYISDDTLGIRLYNQPVQSLWRHVRLLEYIPRFRSLWCHQRPGKLTTARGRSPRVVSFPGRWWHHNDRNRGTNFYSIWWHPWNSSF